MDRTCIGCNESKPKSEFHKNGKYFHSRCKSCLYERDRHKKLARRIKIVKLMGGKCRHCNYAKNYAALDIHHKDPKTKELTGQELKEKPWNKVIEEIKKCELLCRNCHMEFHHPHLNIGEDLNLPEPVPNLQMNVGKCPRCQGDTFGTKFCSTRCASISKRKSKRPRKATLRKKMKIMSWCAMGREYGVSDNAVRKWAKAYELL